MESQTNKERLNTQKYRIERCGSAHWDDWWIYFDHEFRKRIGDVKLICEKDREYILSVEECRKFLKGRTVQQILHGGLHE